MQAGLTLHVEAAGEDDHHVAEAAFKALGRALREACARNGPPRARRRARCEGRARRLRRGQPAQRLLRLRACRGEARVSADPAEVADAPLAVIAGVGNTGAAARGLGERGLDRRAAASGSAPAGRCSGSASACSSCSARARRAAPAWRSSTAASSGSAHGVSRTWAGTSSALTGPDRAARRPRRRGRLLRPLVRLRARAAPVAVAEVDHDGPVVAAVERGAVAGVQFHPERSGAAGARLLRNAVAWSRSA